MDYRQHRSLTAKSSVFFFSGMLLIAVAVLGFIIFSEMNSSLPENYVEWEATIIDFDEGYDTTTESYTTRTIIQYEYEDYTSDALVYNEYNSSMDIGDKVTIYIDPSEPEEYAYPSVAWGFYLICGAFIAIALFGIITNWKRMKAPAYGDEGVDLIVDGYSDNIKEDSVLHTYKMYYCGKMNQSYAVQDENGKVIYEMDLKKFHLFAASEYEFNNWITRKNDTHKIGKTATYSSGGRHSSMVTRSTFTFDGEDIFAFLNNRGYSIKLHELNLLAPSYAMMKGDEIIAVMQYDMHAEREENVVGIGKHMWKLNITSKSDNLDLLVLAGLVTMNTECSMQMA